MELVYFTITAVVLYIVSDRLLQTLELRAGRRFENRSLVFFAILLVLALLSFTMIRRLTGS